MVTGQSRETSWQSLAEAAFLHGLVAAQRPERVWVVTLEDATAGRRAVATFLLVGGDEEHAVGARVRADASMPLPARRRRIRLRRRRSTP